MWGRTFLALLSVVGIVAGGWFWWSPPPGPLSLVALSYVVTFGTKSPGETPFATIRLGVDDINATPLAVLPLVVLAAVHFAKNPVMGRRAGDVWVWCLALLFGSVALAAQDIVSLLAGTVGAGFAVAWIIGRSGVPESRRVALRFGTIQAVGVGLVTMAASVLVACQSLMHGAPRSAPGAASLSIDNLTNGLSEIAAAHPVAAQIESQLVPFALLPLLLGSALLGAIFPLQAWFGGVSRSAPTGVRIWMGLFPFMISVSLWLRLVFPLMNRVWDAWPQWGVPLLCCGLLLATLTSAMTDEAGRVAVGAVLFVHHLVLLGMAVEPVGDMQVLWVFAWLPMAAAIVCGLAAIDREEPRKVPAPDEKTDGVLPGSLGLLFVAGTACFAPASVFLLTQSLVVRLVLGGMLGSTLLLLIANVVWTYAIVRWTWRRVVEPGARRARKEAGSEAFS